MCGQRRELLGVGSVCQVGKEQRECLRCKLRPFQHRRLHSCREPVFCAFGGFIFWWWLFLQTRQRKEIYSARRALGTPRLSQVQAWTCFGGKVSFCSDAPSCRPGRRSVSCSPSEMWLIAQEGQRSKTRRSQPAGLSPERSRWLSGFFVRYSLEKHPKFLLDGEMRNVSRVAVTSLS